MQQPYTRRQFLASGLAATCALGAGPAFGQAGARQNNVLFIPIDDLRPQLGCYGFPRVHTPHLDRLATDGTLFERAYCQQAVCGPSRASVLTGMYPDRCGVRDNVAHFRDTVPEVTTLPQHFRENGYETVGLGKVFHRGKGDDASWSEWIHHGAVTQYADPANRQRELARIRAADEAGLEGMERFLACRIQPTESFDAPDGAYPDGMIAEKAIAAMERLAEADAPFFLAPGFMKPHLPFTCPRSYWDLYDPRDLDLWLEDWDGEGIPEPALHNSFEARMYDWVPEQGPFPRDLCRRLLHGYLACTSFVDAQVGRLLDALDRLGLAETTSVVVWGDHGWHLGDHGVWGKDTNFEQATWSPLIVRAPGRPAGRRVRDLVEFVDIYPTTCALAGLPLPAHLQGRSLVPLMEGAAVGCRGSALSQTTRGEVVGYSLRTDGYRYNEWVRPHGEVYARELYDHATDPEELDNRAGDPAMQDVAEDLSTRLEQRVIAAGR